MRKTCYLIGIAVSVAVVLATPAAAGALPQVPASKFEPATDCGCHAGLLEQWSASMHAKALSDPVFVYKRDEGDKATGGALGAFCNACHAPVAVMSGEIGSAKMSAQSAEGVGCDFCHQVTGSTRPLGNTSQRVAPTGVKRAQLKEAKPPAHAWAYSEFHETAEFCGACHNVDHPANGMHLEATYTEWKNSPYAAQGFTCQDCHMTPGPGVVKPNPGTAAAGAAEREHIYTMTFAGANVAQGDSERATARLKAAATVDMQVSEIVASGATTEVVVTVTNVGAGHYLPTGLTEVRQMWLEVNAVADDGTTTSLGRRDFGTVLKDAKGSSPVELWEATGIASDDRIPPLQSIVARYPFKMTSDAPARIEAVLNYRSMPDEMAKAAGVENPITEMARAESRIWASDDARSGSATDEESGGTISAAVWIAVIGSIVAVAAVAFVLLRSRSRRNA